MNNGRRYSQKIKQKAIIFRENGRTHREIGKKLGITPSTAHYYTKGIILTTEQKRAVKERRNKGCFITSSILTKEQRNDRRKLAYRNLKPYWKPRPTDNELIQRIVNFYKEYDRIPFKREFNNIYKEYRKRFGSWNNAIQLAGFKSNPVLFSKKCIAKDGHSCDSYAEKIIDDFLFNYEIKHKKNFPYLNRKMTADFAIGDTRIEYFGLKGLNKVYDESIRIKRNICKKEKLKLIEIYPSELFSGNLKNCLEIFFKTIKK